MLPGLVDSHTHPGLVTSSGDYFLLPQTLDPKQLLSAVAEQARSHPTLPILVGGYWPIAAFPTSGPRKEDLDRVVPDRPVVLFDDSGHSQWLNSRALALMGVDRNDARPRARPVVLRARPERRADRLGAGDGGHPLSKEDGAAPEARRRRAAGAS